MFKEKLNLDDRDSIIISKLQNNPFTSQEDLAKELKLSQPSVSARIRKLREKGVLQQIVGTNLKKIDLPMAKIDISTTETESLLKEFQGCPFFINGFVTSGKHNLCMLFIAKDLKTLEGIVNYHLRCHPKVKEIEMNIIIKSAKDFVVPLNLNDKQQITCEQNCIKGTRKFY
ncbi:MAG: Lrp/AsnC family transcriptional regulator [Nanoarchaeota archaeon]|nr:Lrp/AsnC family transcriptional regulator [Nanoarchaeota archaeon]MBU1598373.1 Lrp/AsnC family transcriptional regulator [Nanoarchaeota archaeon]